ncbi:PDDEXK nuclease domain-containing protein [Pedobacter hiemivivus]|uniref:DUF1016 domain-containing protein n=1 Tax=Pedobacter hiemivivus TaxID=2530454 RepID=A0A4R0NEG3_9SPHI|nr:PDDEXK nuclease domain-containing protein [Pedobacter hiemivivus]TCC97552.1 DUF1016 domain-containing protein [Pedobacter hiemivivus]
MELEKQQTQFILEIKEKVRSAQYEALKTVNTQLINLYWEIGKSITEKQKDGWGKSIVPKLSTELQKEFPGIGGFSSPNLWLMAQFYTEYQSVTNLVPLVREISWSKHITILKKCKNDMHQREFYIRATKKFGWTKDVLIHQIENKTFEKYLLNQTNLEKALPEPQKKLAQLAIKDHYTFDFLNITEGHQESDLEQTLIKNIKSFLLEMGSDYAFIGNQYKLEVGGQEFFIDLLLFHRKLQAMIAIELKIGDFLPEHKGKMEFYLAVLNDKVRLPHENESIGIIICKNKNRTVVEYSLNTSSLPIGVATYSTTNTLPNEYKSLLPSAKDIEDKLQGFFNET